MKLNLNLPPEALARIIIIGNSGSGKTFLARTLNRVLQTKVIHLDRHFWEPGGFERKRPREVLTEEILMLSMDDRWIMEGVFGDLAELALPNATTLIFLDLAWDECRTSLLQRGAEPEQQQGADAADRHFEELLAWAKDYWGRENSCSQRFHQRLFDEFTGWKAQLTERSSVDALIARLISDQGLI